MHVQVVRPWGFHRSPRPIASGSLMVLVLSVVVSLVAQNPAEAAENCPAIQGTLTSLRAQHTVTTIQMQSAIQAAVKVNGKVDLSVIGPYLPAYTTATNSATTQLPGQGTCQNVLVVGSSLGAVINNAAIGAKLALDVISPPQLNLVTNMILQHQIALINLIQAAEQASPGSRQIACQGLTVNVMFAFPQVRAACGR